MVVDSWYFRNIGLLSSNYRSVYVANVKASVSKAYERYKDYDRGYCMLLLQSLLKSQNCQIDKNGLFDIISLADKASKESYSGLSNFMSPSEEIAIMALYEVWSKHFSWHICNQAQIQSSSSQLDFNPRFTDRLPYYQRCLEEPRGDIDWLIEYLTDPETLLHSHLINSVFNDFKQKDLITIITTWTSAKVHPISRCYDIFANTLRSSCSCDLKGIPHPIQKHIPSTYNSDWLANSNLVLNDRVTLTIGKKYNKILHQKDKKNNVDLIVTFKNKYVRLMSQVQKPNDCIAEVCPQTAEYISSVTGGLKKNHKKECVNRLVARSQLLYKSMHKNLQRHVDQNYESFWKDTIKKQITDIQATDDIKKAWFILPIFVTGRMRSKDYKLDFLYIFKNFICSSLNCSDSVTTLDLIEWGRAVMTQTSLVFNMVWIKEDDGNDDSRYDKTTLKFTNDKFIPTLDKAPTAFSALSIILIITFMLLIKERRVREHSSRVKTQLYKLVPFVQPYLDIILVMIQPIRVWIQNEAEYISNRLKPLIYPLWGGCNRCFEYILKPASKLACFYFKASYIAFIKRFFKPTSSKLLKRLEPLIKIL